MPATETQVAIARLMILRRAIGLEIKENRSRHARRHGRSVTAIARKEVGGGRTRRSVLDAVESELVKLAARVLALDEERIEIVEATGFGD